jgi:hypothetical protein
MHIEVQRQRIRLKDSPGDDRKIKFQDQGKNAIILGPALKICDPHHIFCEAYHNVMLMSGYFSCGKNPTEMTLVKPG